MSLEYLCNTNSENQEGNAGCVFERSGEVLVVTKPVEKQAFKYACIILNIERVKRTVRIAEPCVQVSDQH